MTTPDWSGNVAAAIDHLDALTYDERDQVRAWLSRRDRGQTPADEIADLADRAADVGLKRAGFESGLTGGAASMRLRRAGFSILRIREMRRKQSTKEKSA